MKVFYPLLCYYPSQAGGPANTIYWLNRSMGLKGHSTVVMSTNYGLPPDYDLDVKPFNIFNIDIEFVSGNLLPFLKVSRLRRAFSADVIHFSSLFFQPTLALIILGILLNKKILMSPRGELYNAALSRRSTLKTFYIRILRVLARKIHFHATNELEGKQIRETFPNAKSISVLPNYIQLPKRVNTSKKKQILFLGRINSIKNIELLIRAYAILPAETKIEYKLIIAGEAKLSYEKVYLAELQRLVSSLNLSNNIVFLGGMFNSQKELLLAESICTVLPSKSENFGNVVLESLCQATPVIVSQNAPWEMVESCCAGFWIEPSVSGIYKALMAILKMNSKDYETLQSNALSIAINKFDIEKNIQKWEVLYTNLN